MSEPIRMWEHFPEFWKTESAFLSFIRGGVRRHLWSKNPVKLQFMKENRVKMVNTNPRSMKAHPTVWGFECSQCKKQIVGNACEVDHKKGGHSLRKVGDIQKFVEGIVFIRKEDLAILCKPCHKIKTLAERQGMSHEDAAIEKEAITICKGTATEVKSWITKRGEVPARLVKERREQVTRLLKEGK